MRIKKQIVFVLGVIVCSLAQQGLAQSESQPRLEPKAAAGAVDAFKAALDERWSYRYASRADFDAAILLLRKRIQGGISQNELGMELQKILALGIDGHSGVKGFSFPSGGRLPFLIEVVGQRFVAVDLRRKAFLADGFPFVTKIDKHAVDEWCAAASVLVPKGSPQYIRHRCLSQLREFDYWRQIMGVTRKDTIEVELTDPVGKARKTLTLPVATPLPVYGVWPPAGSRLLAGNIGYLRLTNMVTATSVAELQTWMPKFRDTAGLIIDVRDNDGGDRAAMRLLYSYLAALDDPPHVFNAAAYRLYQDHPENHLAINHSMYRANASEWNERERKAVAEFAKKFKPRWKLPTGQFSEWHYMALVRLDEPNVYHYDKPVIVLMNGKCFSATDIFLAGLKGIKNVLLLGTPSAGGSAYSQEIPLGETKLSLRIGSMASFQADGRLFDGNGIYPDVRVDPVPEYFIGGRDNLLEEAVQLIRSWKAHR